MKVKIGRFVVYIANWDVVVRFTLRRGRELPLMT